MFRLSVEVLLAACCVLDAQDVTSQALLKVSAQAALFQDNLPKSLSQETLSQKAWMPPSRFHPSKDPGTVTVPKPRLLEHEVVSEYSVGPLKNSTTLVEFRQVVSVDGKTVRTPESARRELTMGIRSQDDSVRKRMLQDYAKYGLVDVATDYGLILLAFTKQGLEGMTIKPVGQNRIGAEAMLVFSWKQGDSDTGELAFRGRQAIRSALQGTLWVRASDFVPLRIETWAEYEQSNHRIRDEATVDYVASSHGFLTPASVLHHHIVDRQLLTENLYRYAPFRLFFANTEIKFADEPDALVPTKK